MELANMILWNHFLSKITLKVFSNQGKAWDKAAPSFSFLKIKDLLSKQQGEMKNRYYWPCLMI